MKCVRGQWLVKLFEYLSDSPVIMVSGFHAACIHQSIDTGKPMFEGDLVTSEETSSDKEDVLSESSDSD